MTSTHNLKHLALQKLHALLSHNVLHDKAYRNRYNGFTAEMHFKEWYLETRGHSLIDGGMFVPNKKYSKHFDNSVFFLSSQLKPTKYVNIFTKASKLAPVGQFYIQYNLDRPIDKWTKETLFSSHDAITVLGPEFPVPPFKIFKFSVETQQFTECTITEMTKLFTKTSKALVQKYIPEHMVKGFMNKFAHFSLVTILELYVERLFFDGFLNVTYERGSPLDIDAFVKNKSKQLTILEIKEKDVSKGKRGGFGMDNPRVASLLKLQQIFNTPSYYVVRHIDNQRERNFLDWKFISIDNFVEQIKGNKDIEGGTGMRSIASKNPTKVCPIIYFKSLV